MSQQIFQNSDSKIHMGAKDKDILMQNIKGSKNWKILSQTMILQTSFSLGNSAYEFIAGSI
jgi:hypothetical protein